MGNFSRRFLAVAIVLAASGSSSNTPRLSAGQASTNGNAERSYTTWSSYLGTPDSAQYSALKQINKSNVKQLQVAWTFPAGDGTIRFDPVVVDGVMYVLTGSAVDRRARCGHRQGALDPPQRRRRRGSRDELLGKLGSIRSTTAVSQRRLSDGHRRADRQRDRRFRRQRSSGHAGRARIVTSQPFVRFRPATRDESSKT